MFENFKQNLKMSNFDSDNDFCNSICDESNYYEAQNGNYYAPVVYGKNQGNFFCLKFLRL